MEVGARDQSLGQSRGLRSKFEYYQDGGESQSCKRGHFAAGICIYEVTVLS